MIRIVPFDKIEPQGRLARRDGVTMANPHGALWIAALDEENITGWVCLVINSKTGAARFKSDFVREEYRGHGVYQGLFRARERIASINKVKTATAYCGPMSIKTYLRYGFRIVKKIGNTENIFVRKEY